MSLEEEGKCPPQADDEGKASQEQQLQAKGRSEDREVCVCVSQQWGRIPELEMALVSRGIEMP